MHNYIKILIPNLSFNFKFKKQYIFIQQSHFWGYTQRNATQVNSKGTCTPMFIAALFTIAKLWKQPRCPITDEWIKEM
jgi:hypothetical protein